MVLLATPARARAVRYTLEQLLAKVQSDYPGVLAAREGVGGADAQIHQANRLWMPTGDLTFGITGSPSVQCHVTDPLTGAFIDKDPMGNPIPRNARLNHCDSTGGYNILASDQFLPLHGAAFNLSLNLLQPLYTSGKIEAAREGARTQREAAQDNVEVARADVVLNAVRAYWGLKTTRAVLATMEEGRDKLSDWIKSVEKDMEGNAPKYTPSDGARLKLALDNLELVIVDMTRNRDIALSGLRVLVGEPDADVDEEELDVEQIQVQPLSYYQDEARLHRPEAKLLDAGIHGAKIWKRIKLTDLLPDFGLAFNFTYGYAQSVDNPSNAFMQHTDVLGVSLLLVMRQPLDFGMRLARLEQAAADERAAQQRRKQALGGIEWDIASAYANLEEAHKRYDRTGHAEKISRGWYRSLGDKLDSGEAQTTRDLAEAARNYFEMRIRHLQSIMDVNVARAQLRRSTGVN
jgi:outer membrane protein TolC